MVNILAQVPVPAHDHRLGTVCLDAAVLDLPVEHQLMLVAQWFRIPSKARIASTLLDIVCLEWCADRQEEQEPVWNS